MAVITLGQAGQIVVIPDKQLVDPGPPQVAPGPPTQLGADLLNGLAELAQAQPAYAKAAAYYEGNEPEYFASYRMRIAMGATGVRFKFNFACLPVDAVAERLEIAGISTPDDASLEVVDSVWRSNQLDVYAPNVMLNACKLGDAYLMVWPDVEQELNADGIPDISIDYQSPRICRVFYDPNNERKKQYAIKRWEGPRGVIFANLYYPDRIEKYMQVEDQTTGEVEWVRRLDEPGEPWPIDNPYGEVPIFHFRTDFPYGNPEHINAYGPQDAIDKIVISHMASVDYNAFPQRYAILKEGYDTSEAADDGDSAFTINTGLAVGQEGLGVDPASTLTSDPASVWFMKGIEGYGQFPPGDPQAFLQPFERYIHAMAVVTNTPMHFMDPIVSNVSGESLRLIEAPFARKVRNRQMMFGTAWRDLFRFVLEINGRDAGVAVRVNWTPASTVNDLSTLQGEMIKVQLGVPQWQVLLEQGYTPEQLDAWGVSKESTPVQLPGDTGQAQAGEFATGDVGSP